MTSDLASVRQRFGDRLTTELQQALDSQGVPAPLVVLNGVPGVGKSTMVARSLASRQVTWVSPRLSMLPEVEHAATLDHLVGAVGG